ncbi:MAG TPA: DUF4340 domain-containing protein [Polyangiaceae bacterium]|nr:DUF4340 domain-containing protein [Polyangiaceae bacterium]
MNSEIKLYAAIGVLAVLGGALFLTNKKQQEEAATYTLSGQSANLPKIEIKEDDVKAIDKIVLTKGEEGDAGAPREFTLVKKGEDWRLSQPVDAEANQSNVKSMLDNLKTLKVSEVIDPGKGNYDQYKVSDGKGLHAVFTKGGATVLDAWFGENGGRGQMARLAGKDGVYAVKGYSSYLYDRDAKGWRDTTIFKFEDTAVNAVTIDNEHGSFAFAKSGDTWTAKFKEPKAGAAKDLEKFDDSKLKDMLRAYKGLNADGFADKEKKPADLGLDKPTATVVITLNDGAKREVKVGATAEGSSRWVQASGIDDLVSISSWAADWALAEPKKFQKSDDAKKDDKPKPAMPSMPHPMGATPG